MIFSLNDLWSRLKKRCFPEDKQPIIKWFWRLFLKPHTGSFWGSIFCMALVALMTAVSAHLVKDVFDGVFVERDVSRLWSLVGTVIIVFLTKGLAAYGHSFFLMAAGQKISVSLQRGLFKHIIHSDHTLFQEYTSGKLLSTLTYETQVIFRSLTQTLVSVVRDILTLTFLVMLMFYRDWILALMTCVGFPLSVLLVVRLGRRMRFFSSKVQEAMGRLHAFFQEAFQGIGLIKAYTLERYGMRMAYEATENFLQLNLKNTRMRAILHPLMELTGGAAVSFVLLYGGYQVITGGRTPGTLMSFLTAFVMSHEPMKKLAHLNGYLQEALAALQRIYALYTKKPKINDKPRAKALLVSRGEIAFHKVRFGYGKATVFEGFSCLVPGGKCVAIVGESGAGKSTLFHLMLRFYDVQQGHITIDGQSIQEISIESLRHQIAFVSQEVVLFDDTIENNIRYGDLAASQEAVQQAAENASASQFIESLPQGYQTRVGEMGRSLSGGQRQRIAIARAFLKNAPILCMDEATSSLDTVSEFAVQKALERLMRGRTTLIVAHRLSTVQKADVIHVLEGGKIVQSGTHSQLMGQKGAYQKIVLPQLHHIKDT